MLYLSFSLYTWLAFLMAQGQELWELKRLDGRVSFGVWSMCVDANMHFKINKQSYIYNLYIMCVYVYMTEHSAEKSLSKEINL